MSAIVYVGIGSNLDHPAEQVQRAIAAIACTPDIRLLRHSPWYRTAPIGPAGQDDYINGIAELETNLAPEALLQALQAIELRQGRVRAERWGARTLDLDIILYDNIEMDTPALTIPHREMRQRGFVLQPLADLVPDFILPDGQPLKTLLASCPLRGIVRFSDGSSL